MAWVELLTALALVFILEGLLPFASPRRYRHMVAQVVGMSDNAIRIVGLVLILIGLIVFTIVRH